MKALEKGGGLPVPAGSGVPAPAPAVSPAPPAMPLVTVARGGKPAVPSGRGRGAGKGRGRGAGVAPAHQGNPVPSGPSGAVAFGACAPPSGGRGKRGGQRGYFHHSFHAPQPAFTHSQQVFYAPPQHQSQSFYRPPQHLQPPGPPPLDLNSAIVALGEWARQQGPSVQGGGAVPVPLATSSPVAAPAPRARGP